MSSPEHKIPHQIGLGGITAPSALPRKFTIDSET